MSKGKEEVGSTTSHTASISSSSSSSSSSLSSSSSVTLEVLKARNNTNFSWTEDETNIVNKAFNKGSDYVYFEVTTIIESKPIQDQTRILGYLDNGEIKPLKDVSGNLIIELLPFSKDDIVSLRTSIRRNLRYLREINKEDVKYPIKFLAPYRIGRFHWNILEIVVKDGEQKDVSCKIYDTDGFTKIVPPVVFTAIKEVFSSAQNQKSDLKYYENSGQFAVNCGLVSAIMMHDLKVGDKKFYNGWINSPISSIDMDQNLRDNILNFVFGVLGDEAKNFAKPVTIQVGRQNYQNLEFNDEQKAMKKKVESLKIDTKLKVSIKELFEKHHEEFGLDENLKPYKLKNLITKGTEIYKVFFNEENDHIKEGAYDVILSLFAPEIFQKIKNKNISEEISNVNSIPDSDEKIAELRNLLLESFNLNKGLTEAGFKEVVGALSSQIVSEPYKNAFKNDSYGIYASSIAEKKELEKYKALVSGAKLPSSSPAPLAAAANPIALREALLKGLNELNKNPYDEKKAKDLVKNFDKINLVENFDKIKLGINSEILPLDTVTREVRKEFLEPPRYSGIGVKASYEYIEAEQSWKFAITEVFPGSLAAEHGVEKDKVLTFKKEEKESKEEALIRIVKMIRSGEFLSDHADGTKRPVKTSVFEEDKDKKGYKLSEITDHDVTIYLGLPAQAAVSIVKTSASHSK